MNLRFGKGGGRNDDPKSSRNKGKKSDTSPPPKKRALRKVGETSRQQREEPQPRPLWVEGVERFFTPWARDRFRVIKPYLFNKEKKFDTDLMNGVEEIGTQMRRRKWMRFNSLIEEANGTLVKEFYANAFRPKDVEFEFTTTVRGKLIDFSADALNEFLGPVVPEECALMIARQGWEHLDEPARRVYRDFCGREGTSWLKWARGHKPTKISLTHFAPLPRAWAEYYVENLESVGNHSEYQFANSIAVKLIMEGAHIDLGILLSKSIQTLACKVQKYPFRLGHASLITALCRREKVINFNEDDPVRPLRPLTLKMFDAFDNSPVVVRPNEARGRGNVGNEGQADDEVHEEEDLEAEIDGFEGVQHHEEEVNAPFAEGIPPEVPPNRHSVNEVAALLTQLDISTALRLPHNYYDQNSSLYQEAMTRRAQFYPQPYYPLYPTYQHMQERWAHQDAELRARQSFEGETWHQQFSEYQDASDALHRELFGDGSGNGGGGSSSHFMDHDAPPS
jgi:hypothetical protein